jgi:hypothetical protein
MYIIIDSETKSGTNNMGFHNLIAHNTTICIAPMSPRASVINKKEIPDVNPISANMMT